MKNLIWLNISYDDWDPLYSILGFWQSSFSGPGYMFITFKLLSTSLSFFIRTLLVLIKVLEFLRRLDEFGASRRNVLPY